MKPLTTVARLTRTDLNDPIAVLETIAEENKWPLEKHAEDEVSFDCIGRWGELTMSFLWQDEFQSLQLCCSSDLKVTEQNRSAILDMLYQVNRKTWAGFFMLDDSEEYVVFRYTSLMRQTNSDIHAHIEDMLEVALAEMDQFYPAFQSVVQSHNAVTQDNSAASVVPHANHAMLLTLLAETMGEA